MVFEDAIDRRLNPAVSYVTPGAQALPLEQLVARARAAFPSAQLASITFPEAPDIAMQINAVAKPESFAIGINQYTGDGIMALFGAPIAHEDHAQRACYAALHLREEITRYATEVKCQHGVSFATRMGLNSGEVIVGKIGRAHV